MIYRTKFNRFVNENNVEVTSEEHLSYLQSGGVIEETDFNFPEDKEVPQTISQMKLRLQLILSGVSIASIYAMIDQIPDVVQKELVYAKWEYAVIFERSDATLNSMAQMLSITQEQLDDIFINGNNL